MIGGMRVWKTNIRTRQLAQRSFWERVSKISADWKGCMFKCGTQCTCNTEQLGWGEGFSGLMVVCLPLGNKAKNLWDLQDLDRETSCCPCAAHHDNLGYQYLMFVLFKAWHQKKKKNMDGNVNVWKEGLKARSSSSDVENLDGGCCWWCHFIPIIFSHFVVYQ